jgi:hypothetical protein
MTRICAEGCARKQARYSGRGWFLNQESRKAGRVLSRQGAKREVAVGSGSRQGTGDSAGRWTRRGLMGGGRGRWGSGEWGVAGQPQRPKKGRQGNVGQAFLPARVCQRRQECPRHTGAQSSLPVGSPGRAGSPGSAGGLEDEDEDEDDWSGLMRFCRPFFSFRQSVGTKCGDEAYPTKRGDKV